MQRVLAAKRDLRLEKDLAALDGFDAVILDDIGYVQQRREDMEVLFTSLAERYERRSVIITSNLVFSEWDRIFKDASCCGTTCPLSSRETGLEQRTTDHARRSRPLAPVRAALTL